VQRRGVELQPREVEARTLRRRGPGSRSRTFGAERRTPRWRGRAPRSRVVIRCTSLKKTGATLQLNNQATPSNPSNRIAHFTSARWYVGSDV
jgi:hypothetical protein